MLNSTKYISTVPFSGLFNWSVQYLNDSKISFSKAYPMMRIGEFLKRNKTAVSIEDDKTYKRATIKVRNGGIFLRDEEIGSKIGTKSQFLISKGQFLLSKIDARNGAFGVVPEVLDGGIITGNFWTFDVDYSIINPHYLALLTTTEAFVQFCEQASNGTTNRHYLQEPLFLNIKVPVPSLEEQNKLVEEYVRKIEQSDKLAKEASDNEEKLEKYILEELGISRNKSFTECSENSIGFVFLKFVRYKNIDKWSYDAIVDNNQKILKSDYFENRSLKTLLYINPNTSFSDLDDNDEISFVPMESVSDKYGELKEYKTCKKSSSKGYTKFKNGDLIWAKITPCMQNGKSTVVGSLSNGYGCGSTEFYVLRNENENLNIDYVHLLLRLSIVLKDAMKHFTGSAGQQRVPKTYLENLSIPYPPLYVQNNIVRSVKKQMEEIKQMRSESEKLKQEALIDFENEIFR